MRRCAASGMSRRHAGGPKPSAGGLRLSRPPDRSTPRRRRSPGLLGGLRSRLIHGSGPLSCQVKAQPVPQHTPAAPTVVLRSQIGAGRCRNSRNAAQPAGAERARTVNCPADTKLRSSKYLNNLIEQDQRGVKLRVGPMRSVSSGSGSQQSRSPASNCCAGSTRNSSTSAGCASKMEVRPPSGMRCWPRGKADTVVAGVGSN